MMEFKEKLQKIQCELKAPKNLFNSFGKYKYRNAEGICEAVKPMLEKYKLVLILSDEIVLVGDRYYIKATVTISDTESEKEVLVSALARESETKKGMDDSQITGTASSYARKYALNGLFLLDDTKDADTDEFQAASQKQEPKSNKPKDNDIVPTEDFKANDIITDKQKEQLKVLLTALNFKAESVFPKNPKLDLTQAEFGTALQTLRKIQESKGK